MQNLSLQKQLTQSYFTCNMKRQMDTCGTPSSCASSFWFVNSIYIRVSMPEGPVENIPDKKYSFTNIHLNALALQHRRYKKQKTKESVIHLPIDYYFLLCSFKLFKTQEPQLFIVNVSTCLARKIDSRHLYQHLEIIQPRHVFSICALTYTSTSLLQKRQSKAVHFF